MIHIFQPPSDNHLTGGYLYNRRIAEGLPSADVHEVTAGELPTALAAFRGEDDRLLVDSLYIGAVETEALRAHRPIALIHYLPSLDPALAPADRERQSRRESAFLRASIGAVATSEFMRSLLVGRGYAGRVVNCLPGVDDALFSLQRREPAANGPLEVITVANLVPNKGYLEVVAPLARALRGVHWHWQIVGDDGDRAYAAAVRAAIADSGLTAKVTVHGRLAPARIRELLAPAAAHLFPTRFESYGMAVAESVAAGVPVVAPRVGEIPRLVRDGETGLLAPPAAPGELAAALARLLGDAGLLHRLRANCELRRRSVPSWRDAADHFEKAVTQLD